MNKTKEDFFKFEKEQRKFFDDYYRRKGWEYERIIGEENKKYDVLLKIDNEWVPVQEKARSKNYKDFLVELIQDVPSGDKGWLYSCEATFILYKADEEFYWINLKKLRKFIRKNGYLYDTIISNKGWGITLNLIIPWKDLLDNKIAGNINL